MGDEAARAAGDDAEPDPGAPGGLDADNRERERMAGAVRDDAVEQQVVDPCPFQVARLEPPGDRLGAPDELIGRVLVADLEQRGRQVVEPVAGGRDRRAELGGEREREIGVRGAGAAGLHGERDQLHGPRGRAGIESSGSAC